MQYILIYPVVNPLSSETHKQLELLQRYVDTGQSKNITPHYTTNAQLFPNKSGGTCGVILKR